MALRRTPPPRPQALDLVEHSYGYVELYLDDLDDLCAWLDARAEVTSLQAGSALADSPDDLKDATSTELKHVRVITQQPDLQVGLGFKRARIVSDTSSAGRLLADEIVRLLRERRAFPWRQLAVPLGFTAVMTPLLIFGLLIAQDVIQAMLGILAVLVVWWSWWTELGRGTGSGAKIIPRRRGDHRPVRRETLLWMIALVLSVAVGVVLTYWQVSAQK